MVTQRQRILTAARGEMPDVLSYVSCIDPLYNANSVADSLPKKHKG